MSNIEKPKVTKPWSSEMYEWNDKVAELMKTEIEVQIKNNKNDWDKLNELITLCGGIQFGDGYEIEELYDECLKELDNVQNYWLNEEWPYFVDKGIYLGHEEPVLVALSSIIASQREINDKVENLCNTLKQDCIAILVDNYEGKLIYNSRHHELVPKLKFDKDLFIDAYNKDFNKNYKSNKDRYDINNDGTREICG